MIESLKDGVEDVRWVAANVLGEIDDDQAVGPLGEALPAERSAQVRQAIALALRRIDDPAAVPPLIAALKDSDARSGRRSSRPSAP